MIGGLHVTEELRGQGLGRYLLDRMHSELHGRGYRRMVIGTGTDNWRAMLLYATRGYRIICQEYTFRKDMQAKATPHLHQVAQGVEHATRPYPV